MKLKKPSKRVLIGGGLLLVAAIVAGVTLTGSDEERTVVQADLVVRDNISEVVTASGRIQPQTKVDIVAEVSAEIIGIFVQEGDRVRQGQPLMMLDTIQLKSDVAQARYSLDEITARTEAAWAQYEKDKLEYERQTSLFDKKLTSETEFNIATYAYENAKANHRAMQAQTKTGRSRLEKAEDNLTKTHINAPMDGVITFQNAEVGEIAQGQTAFTQGKTLMTVSDLSVFEVEIDVDETEVAKVHVGNESKIRVDAFRDTSFEGTVVEIGNSALIRGEGTQDYSTSFRAKVRFTQAHEAIRPGMSATVDITTNEVNDAVLVPYASVVTRKFDPDSIKAEKDKSDGMLATANAAEAEVAEPGEEKPKSKKIKKTGVFIVKNGKVEFVEIETGIADERNIVALGGLEVGDTIVSGSFQTLRKLAEDDNVTIEESSIESMDEDEE